MQMCVFCKYTKWTNPSTNIFYLFLVIFFFFRSSILSVWNATCPVFSFAQLSTAFFIRALSCCSEHIFPNAESQWPLWVLMNYSQNITMKNRGRANECFSTSKHFMCTHVLWLLEFFFSNQTTTTCCFFFASLCCVAFVVFLCYCCDFGKTIWKMSLLTFWPIFRCTFNRKVYILWHSIFIFIHSIHFERGPYNKLNYVSTTFTNIPHNFCYLTRWHPSQKIQWPYRNETESKTTFRRKMRKN